MSVGAATPQVAILGSRGHVLSPPAKAVPARPWVRATTFAALALYGILRWSTLISGGSSDRLLGLLLLAMLLAVGRRPLARRSRILAAVATVVVLMAALSVAGLPLAWVVHLRVAVTANAIGEGLSALPQVLVPYGGVNQWVRLVIVLGAAVLLFDAALLLAFAPRAMEDLRRAGAALPLVALAAVPTTLVRPTFPYLDGLLLFGLLAAFMWGERIGRRRVGSAVAVCSLAAVGAMFAAPALDRHKAWLNYRAFTGSLAPTAIDTFDWSQSYGPIRWPRHGRVVLEIRAPRPEYWKAEDLDVFNGQAWADGVVAGAAHLPTPSRFALRTWSQSIEVTIRNMKIPDVVGAGSSQQPTDVPQPVVPGFSPGTWTTGSDLEPGDSYTAKVYAPNPSAAQLRSAGANYAGVPDGYRTIQVPASSVPGLGGTVSPQIEFPAFHSLGAVQNVIGVPVSSGRSIIAASVYGPAYALASRLASAAPTPYKFVLGVERWLAHGYNYSENPPPSAYPLESFLFGSRRGYCQQFAGAMALLLRMGGVPARVAVGFTSGHRDRATHRWLVSDLDAHAWVEAWFPKYGWVQFDPTPSSDPALGGRSPVESGANSASTAGGLHPRKLLNAGSTTGAGTSSHRRRPSAGSSDLTALTVIGAVAAAALLVLTLRATKPLSSADALVGELERAMRRAGRVLPAGATLSRLERRLDSASEAAAYVRTLRLARFAGDGQLPTRGQRRALRRQLRAGLGPFGAIRSVWALPPRRDQAATRTRRRSDA